MPNVDKATSEEVGAPDDVITLSRSALTQAIRDSLVEAYSDSRVSGPAPRDTIVTRLIFGVLDRVYFRPQYFLSSPKQENVEEV